ncbi:helix-turn-helix transcriptional regulator [Cryobacterium sp. TMT1-2-2]|uniref:helix-turn-helix transcriptional regulator n=1 Tax=Cryobacterium sp. TMT1-2-2 TaxID=1259233 RepID=UPI00141AB7CE|nr:helix-turn-helix domain-containing protein [Cryobacterium sp. TMT1-2-2]
MLINDLVGLGELIRRRRAELSLSQTDLAEQIGTTRQWVSRLEKGKNDIGTARLLAVLDALELNLEIRPPQPDSAAKVAREGTWRQSLIASDTVRALLQMRKESSGLSAGWTSGLSAAPPALTTSVDPGDLEAGR